MQSLGPSEGGIEAALFLQHTSLHNHVVPGKGEERHHDTGQKEMMSNVQCRSRGVEARQWKEVQLIRKDVKCDKREKVGWGAVYGHEKACLSPAQDAAPPTRSCPQESSQYSSQDQSGQG